MFNEMTYFNGVQETVAGHSQALRRLGGPNTYPHYAAGWAVAGDTPFTWTKQVASNYGGTRNGMVVHWPGGIRAKDEIRSQWHHVIDIAPTAARSRRPARAQERRRHASRTPIEGVSMLYLRRRRGREHAQDPVLRDVRQSRRLSGRLAGRHGAPRAVGDEAAGDTADDIWELYDTRRDFSLIHDLAANNPTKLQELQDLFMEEAAKYRALPIDDRVVERVNAALAGRPDLMAGRTSLTLYEGMDR